MSTAKADKRSRLVQTALQLVYEQGFRKTTLADIAAKARVPLGNMYYYFKTKDEIGTAILERRVADIRATCEMCDAAGSPKDRLQTFVRMTMGNREQVARGGCPIGTLCTELQKEGGALAKDARPLLAALLAWMEAQFRALEHGEKSKGLALHLLSALQGVSLLANSLSDPELMVLEANRLEQWIRAL